MVDILDSLSRSRNMAKIKSQEQRYQARDDYQEVSARKRSSIQTS